MRWLTLAMFLVVTTPAQCAEGFTGLELVKACTHTLYRTEKTQDQLKGMRCVAFIEGFMAALDRETTPVICTPVLTMGDATIEVLRYFMFNREALTLDAGAGVRAAFLAKYPCGKDE